MMERISVQRDLVLRLAEHDTSVHMLPSAKVPG